jgi:prophage antirepressor-like protein
MIVYDDSNNIWFKFKDILTVLGYSGTLKHYENIKINIKNIIKYKYIKVPYSTTVPYNMQQTTKFINESGLYELLSISTKPLAKIFMDKYFADIMPSIRKNGKYILDKLSKKNLDKINKKLSSIKRSNKDLLLNMKNIDYPVGNHIYIIKQKNTNKTYYKIGYTKNLNKRIKTYNTGNVNKIYFNYIIKVDNIEIDKCIKKIMKNQEYIKNKEFYKISLNSALRFINKCSSDINNISCGYCLKEYKFDTISKHKCKLIN